MGYHCERNRRCMSNTPAFPLDSSLRWNDNEAIDITW